MKEKVEVEEKKPKTQTVTVGGREINVPDTNEPKQTETKQNQPKPTQNNPTVGGRELSTKQKNQSITNPVYTKDTSETERKVLGSLNNAYQKVENAFDKLGQMNKDYRNDIAAQRQARYEKSRQKVYEQDDIARGETLKTITQDDYKQFYNQDGSSVDFDAQIKDLNSQRSTLENIINTAQSDAQKLSAQSELDNVNAQIQNFDLLKAKREAFEEDYALNAFKETGDEESYNSYREMISHKNDNLLERAGSATQHLLAQTINEIPTFFDQTGYAIKTGMANQGIEDLKALYDSGQVDTDEYVRALGDLDNKIKEAKSEYNDSTSMMIRNVVDRYGANTYYGANDVEKFLLQAGESTAQFLLHFAVGKAVSGLAFGEKTIMDAGIQAVTEQFGQEALASFTKDQLISYGTNALGGGIATVTMSGVSATEKMNQLLQEGYDPQLAYANGLMSGLVSYMTEKVGMDWFVESLGTHASVDILGSVLKNRTVGGFMSEGLEEVVEGLVDPIFDAAMLGKDYTVNGSELLMSFMLGGVSGAAMSGGAVAINTINDSLNVNSKLKMRADIRNRLIETNKQIRGKLIIESKRDLNIAKSEMELLERNYPTMTEQQKRSFENVRSDYEDAVKRYESMSVAQAVTFPEDVVETPTAAETDNTVVETLTPDFNQEVQTTYSLDELQSKVDQSIDQVIRAEANVTMSTQLMLDANGYNIDAEVFNSLNDKAQSNALAALDAAKALNLDVNITTGEGFRQAILENNPKISKRELNKALKSNGFVTGDGKIVIDANKRPILSTLSHELTHGTESSKFYKDLRDLVKEKLGSEWDSRLEERKKTYKGIKNADPEKELVARYVEDFLGDESFVSDIVRYNYSLASRIWQNIKALGNSDETVQIRNAFQKAFRDTELAREERGENGLKKSGSPSFSISSIFQSTGMTIQKNGNKIEAYVDGEKVDRVTVEDVKNSPIGRLYALSVEKKVMKEAEMEKQLKMQADLCNLILDTNDPDLVWAISGSIGYQPASEKDNGKLDETHNTHSSAFTSNADKQYNRTFDVTTICLKTQQVINVMSETMKTLGRGLTEEEIIKGVYAEVKKAGEPVPCPVCYVFSRWVGVGGLLDNIKNYQEEYKNADLAALRKRYNALSKEVDKMAKKKGIKGTDARAKVEKLLTEEYNALEAKESRQMLIGQSLSKEEKVRLEDLKEDIKILDRWSWIGKVRLSSNYKPVPPEILFDMNKGEQFANDYPETWTYRTTRGPAMGKAMTPYTAEVLGQTVLGFSGSKDSMKKLGSKRSAKTNPFLKDNITKSMVEYFRKAVANAKAQNLIGGSRAQSTSDFRFEYVLDYFLHFAELEAIGSYGQTYTKVPEAVALLASVNYETNMSLMGKGYGWKESSADDPNAVRMEYDYGELKKGQYYTLEFSNVTGMNPEDAFRLTGEYDCAQPIIVGINDEHIRLCMADPRISFIIPYHASGSSEGRYLEMMKVVQENVYGDARKDYSKVQNDKLNEDATPDQLTLRQARLDIIMGKGRNLSAETMKLVRKNEILSNLYDRFYIDGVDDECYHNFLKKDQAEQIFPYEYWDQTSTIENADINGARFVEYCEALGITPRFEKFSKESGYWKMLIDRRMYGRDGKYRKQQAINLNDFNSDFLFRDKMVEGIVQPSQQPNQDPKFVKGISNKVVEKINETRFSYDGDDEIDSDYMEAVRNNDTAKAQKIVDEVAKKNGYTIKAYHGTNKEFTKFDRDAAKNFNNFLRYGEGFYFAPSAEETKGYGKNTMSVYLSADRLLDASKPVENEKAYQYLIDNGYHPGDARFAMNYGDRFIDALYDILLKDYSQSGANVQVQSLLREFGYDGIAAFYGANNEKGEVVVFDPTQIKSADAITYDDNGKVIPPSQRFNESNPDIRYSFDVDEMINDIFESMSAEEFSNYMKNGEFTYASKEEVEDDPEVQEEGLWVKDPISKDPDEGYIKIDDGYVSDGKTVAWKDERIDALIEENETGNLSDDAGDNKKYKYFYAVNMSPNDYIALSYLFEPKHNKVWRSEIQDDYYNKGELNPERLGSGGVSGRLADHIYFLGTATGVGGRVKIERQEGNHRSLILSDSGYSKMPVIVGVDQELTSGYLRLEGMDAGRMGVRNPNSKLFTTADYAELTRDNYDKLKRKFGSGANADIRYSTDEPGGDVDNVTQAQDNVLMVSDDALNITPTNKKKALKDNAVAEILRESPAPQTAKEKWERAKRIAKHEIIDHLDAVRELSRKYKNNKIIAKADYAMYAPNMAAQTIGNKRFKLGTNKVIGESLVDIVGDLNEDQQYTLSEYLYHWRNVDSMTLFDRMAKNQLEEVKQQLKELDQSNLDEKAKKKKRKELEKKQKELRRFKNKPVFGESVTAEDSKKRIAEIESEDNWVKEKAKRIWEFCRQNRQMLVDAGIISTDMNTQLAEMNPHYVPIQRNKTGGSGVKATDPNRVLKKFKGSSIDILPLFGTKDDEGTLVKQTYNVYKSVLANDLHNEIMNTVGGLTDMNPDEAEEILDNGFNPLGEDGKEMYAYRNGKKYSMPISEDLYNSLTPVKNPWGLPNLKPLQSITEFRRNLITGWNPMFMATNAIKDLQDAIVNTKYPLRFIPSFAEAWAQIGSNGELKQLYMANGGEQNSYVNELENARLEIEGSKGVAKAAKSFKKAFGIIVKMNEAIELAPRLAEFISTIKDGKSVQEAMYNAAEITTNFKRGGDTAKWINRNGAAFLNASIQGFDKQMRNIADAKDGGVKGMLTYMAKLALVGGVPLYVLNHLMWKDDDDYEELSDYVKSNYYCVKKYGDGKFIRIPKGRIAAFYQTVLQNGADTITGKAKLWDALMSDLTSFMDNIAPNNPIENFITAPITDAARNKNWYGEDIVSANMLQNTRPSEQYDESTDELSKAIGKLSEKVAEKTGIKALELSPKKVNYVLDQYSGMIGDLGLPVITQKTNVAVDNKLLKGPATAFLDKFTTDSVLKNQNVNDLYTLKDELQQLAGSSTATEEQQVSSKYLTTVSAAMGQLYADIHKVQANPALSNTEKFNQARELKKKINDLAREGLANYDNIDMSGKYASVGGVQYYKSDNGWKKPSKSQLENVQNISPEDKDGYFKTFGDISNERERIKNSTPEGQRADYRDATISAISNSDMSYKGKNALFDSYYSGKATEYINGMNLTDEQKYQLKVANKMAESSKDENGKTISNSKAEATAKAYDELGLLGEVIKYITDNDIKPSDMGLSKSVYDRLKNGSFKTNSSSTTNRSSGKKKSSKSSGKASSGKVARSGGATGKLPQVKAETPIKDSNGSKASFVQAYANTFRRGSKEVSSASSHAQTCPKCGARVSANADRCPNCGTKL